MFVCNGVHVCSDCYLAGRDLCCLRERELIDKEELVGDRSATHPVLIYLIMVVVLLAVGMCGYLY